MSDETPFARPSESHFLGKCDATVEVAMPEQMKADIAAVGALMSPPKSASELIRSVLSDWVYGRKAALQRIVGH